MSSPAGNAIEPKRRQSSHRIDALKGLVVFAFLLLAKIWIERTELGEEADRVTYRFLQEHLEPLRWDQIPPVVVIDITELKPDRWEIGGSWQRVTSRKALRDAIQALADAGASAIGIDIDFSPRAGGLVYTNDPEFFEFCQNLSSQKEIPIRLGVFRERLGLPQAWLGDEKFASLGASIGIPRPTHLPRWVRRSDSPKPLPGLGASLALSQAALVQPERKWLSLIVNEEKVRHSQQLAERDYMVDMGWLKRLMHEKLTNYTAVALSANQDRVRGRIALLGDAEYGRATDVFCVPGMPKPVPGVFLHACGAATQAGRPLYELSFAARLIIDTVLGLFVIWGVAFASQRLETIPHTGTVDTEFLHDFLTVVAILITCALGYALIRITRVMWTDFVLVALSLVLHSPVQRTCGRLFAVLKICCRWLILRVFRNRSN